MPVVEELKRIVEKLTGIGRPAPGKLERLVRLRKPELFRFRDDGETPNNSRLPLVVYRGAVRLDHDYDPAAVLEETFARHGWRDSWRDGVYDFLHFHTATHEVLGIARGRVTVQFGGAKGCNITLTAGDVVVLAASAPAAIFWWSAPIPPVAAMTSRGPRRLTTPGPWPRSPR